LRPGQTTPFTASFKLFAPTIRTPVDRAPLLGASFHRAPLLGASFDRSPLLSASFDRAPLLSAPFDAQLIALMRAPLNTLLGPTGALSAQLTGMRSRSGGAPERRRVAYRRPALIASGARCVGPHCGAADLSAAHLTAEPGATTACAALTTLRVRLGDWRRGDNN
jgi:hypothetical protein